VNDAGVAADAAAIASLAAGRPALVYRRQLADTETPVAAALKLIEPGRGDFLLESVEDGATRGRYSLLGLAPDLVFRADGQNAAINRDWLRSRRLRADRSGDAAGAARAGRRMPRRGARRAAAGARLPRRLFRL
jgi:anthranilate synthase component 1